MPSMTLCHALKLGVSCSCVDRTVSKSATDATRAAHEDADRVARASQRLGGIRAREAQRLLREGFGHEERARGGGGASC